MPCAEAVFNLRSNSDFVQVCGMLSVSLMISVSALVLFARLFLFYVESFGVVDLYNFVSREHRHILSVVLVAGSGRPAVWFVTKLLFSTNPTSSSARCTLARKNKRIREDKLLQNCNK